MSEQELRDAYTLLYRFIANARQQHADNYRVSDQERQERLANCDNALAAADRMKNFCKMHLPPVAIQEVLFDVPERKGGY